MNQLRVSVFLAIATFSVLVCGADLFAQGVFRRDRRVRQPQVRDFTAAEVRESIARGIETLESRQQAKGEWGDVHSYSNGSTALCTLALLNACDRKDTPAIQKGLQAIRAEKVRSTYFTSLKIMCLATADPEGKKYLQEVQTDIDWLIKIQKKSGGWAYGRPGNSGSPDSSNSQFALLALHEAAQMGAVIDEKVWERAKDYWRQCRIRTGGYTYNAVSYTHLTLPTILRV